MQSVIHALLLASAAAFSPKDAAAPLFAAQQAALAKIQAALPLDVKSYPADLGLDTFATADGGSGAMQAWEAQGPANIAWASDLRIEGPTTVASLTVWCSPLKDVPHRCVRTTATADAVDGVMDFRPRAEGGYETMLEDGSYPEPDSREAFMTKGKRTDLDKRFYDGVRDLCASVGGEAAPAGGLEGLKKQAASPVAVDARLPGDDASVAKAAALYEPAVDAWLAWCADDQHALKPGMQASTSADIIKYPRSLIQVRRHSRVDFRTGHVDVRARHQAAREQLRHPLRLLFGTLRRGRGREHRCGRRGAVGRGLRRRGELGGSGKC